MIINGDPKNYLLVADEETILKRFSTLNARVVFSSQSNNETDLGLHIGYASDIYNIFNKIDIEKDEQEWAKIIKKMVDSNEHNIKLDIRSELFQILQDSASKDVDLLFFGSIFHSYLSIQFF